MGKVLLNGKLELSQLYHKSLKPVSRNGNVETEDLVKFNKMLNKLTQNRFFEYYRELRDYYEYLADQYHFDLKMHTVDPTTGEIVPINNKDKVYFYKM